MFALLGVPRPLRCLPCGQRYGSRLGNASLTACMHASHSVVRSINPPAPYERNMPNAKTFALLSASAYVCKIMKDRKTFITVSVMLAAALIAAIAMSAAWIIGTYRERQEDFASAVRHALSQAKQSESRCRESGTKGKHAIISRIINDSLMETYTYPADFATLDIDEVADITGLDFNHYAADVKRIYSMDYPEDPGTGFITIRFLLEFYNALDKMNIPRHEFKLTITSYSGKDTLYHDSGTVRNPLKFESPLLMPDGAKALICHVKTENPEKRFLMQMSGIIISLSAIAIILCLSYIYLIHTVFRQKSLEQMRKDFTDNVTHELKTPISTARAATEALLEYSAGEDINKRQHYLNMIKDRLDILTAMVESILDISSQENGSSAIRAEECIMQDILHGISSETTVKHPEATIHENYPDKSIVLMADRFHLTGAIANILDNAAKYTISKPLISICMKENGNDILITVQDNGIGIPVSERKRIFEKYYRIPTGDTQNVKGFGIGLYYSKLIIERHGGSISVSAAAGGGSVFKIQLPCMKQRK